MHHGGTEARRPEWELTDQILSACIEVHRHLGAGLLESTYQTCLAHELALRGLSFQRELQVPIEYNGLRLDADYRLDFLVQGRVVVELKSVSELLPIHTAQVLTYLALTKAPVGLLVNFNVPVLRHGVRRLIRHPTK